MLFRSARLLWNLGVMSKSVWIQGALAKFSDRAGLNHRHMYLNARDMVRIYAKRRTD